MSLQVFTFTNGRWRQNCYIVANGEREALVIDPGSQPTEIARLVETNALKVRAILNTHAHFDHVGAVADLMEKFQVPFYLHGHDEDLLKRANLYRMVFGAREAIRIPEITHDLSRFPGAAQIGPYEIAWTVTPGHTEGGVCFRLEELLFSGDTLMRATVGRTDLPGGDSTQLVGSLRKLAALPAHTRVYGGHGAPTTIGAEFSPGSQATGLLR